MFSQNRYAQFADPMEDLIWLERTSSEPNETYLKIVDIFTVLQQTF